MVYEERQITALAKALEAEGLSEGWRAEKIARRCIEERGAWLVLVQSGPQPDVDVALQRLRNAGVPIDDLL
jgi:hypothetical protein